MQKIDWILLLDGKNENESENNDLLLQQGLGLSSGLPHSRPNPGANLNPLDRSYLETVNKFDLRLWEEAHKLNTLDVYSLQQLQNYGGEVWHTFYSKKEELFNNPSRCCGNVCMP